MNAIYKFLIPIVFSFPCVCSSGHAQRIDGAPVELKQVADLLKWSDLIVVATEDTFVRRAQIEKFILNKKDDIPSKNTIIVDLSRDYTHIQPVLMGGYQYLLFLKIVEAEETSAKDEKKIICKVTAGGNGVIALFDLDELENHPRILRRKRIMPKLDRIKVWKNRLHKNFGTSDGELIKEAVERVVALYAEEDPKTQAMQMIESLRDGNPAMIRLSQELLQSIDLDAID